MRFDPKNTYEPSTDKIASDRIWIAEKRGVYQSLDVHSILYIQANDHYIQIHCHDRSLPLIKATLKGFYEDHLEPFNIFYQLNRSCIINVEKVKKIEGNSLYLDLDKPLSIPKSKRDEVLKNIGLDSL